MTDLPTTTDLSLTVSRHIKAPPQRVYEAWLHPETLMRFMHNCSGITVQQVETDPRVGGAFLIVMGGTGSPPVPHTGTYLALDPFRHMEFTWASPYSTAENSTVTLDFVAQDAGTLITLTHHRFVSEQSRDGHLGGWSVILDALMQGDL
jgi:uncharacterized protein YndB with AHSA1/START domain